MSEAAFDNRSSNQEKSAEAPLLRIRPTLFIAVGGTGMEIALRLRRRIANHSWGGADTRYRIESLNEFKVAEFIQFDLDAGAVIDSGRSKTEDLQYDLVRFADGDKVVESFNLDKYVSSEDALGKYPHVEKWMPLTPRKIRDLNIDPSKGAGQIRSVSRLYFFDKYAKFRELLAAKLGILEAGLSNASDLRRMGLETEPGRARIVVICSMAGGTGSGAFLDIGFLSKLIGNQVFNRGGAGGCDVDLLVLTPSGFKAANQVRTEANGYAALMELETLLTDGPSRYLQQWAAGEAYEIPRAPYDDIFMLDTGNTVGQVTSQVTDVYQMAADSLFIDFMSEEFANRKRSISVNQKQHKIKPYLPPINQRKYGDTRFSFRQSYSAFGLSILTSGKEEEEDIQQNQLAIKLIRSYFGVEPGSERKNAVEDRILDEACKEQLALSNATIDPPPQLQRDRLPSIGSFALVRQILLVSEKNIVDEIQKRVSDRLDEVRTSFNRRDWRQQLQLIQRALEQTTITDVNSRAETNEEQLQHRAAALLKEFKGRMEQLMFRYLGNPELGGLGYVLAFIEATKQAIDDEATGYRKRLLRNEEAFRDWKGRLQSEIQQTYTYLDQVAGDALFGDNQKKAETKLEHLKQDIAEFLKCHVFMVSSQAASELLGELSKWLGERSVSADTLEVRWSGLAGRFQQGESQVRSMIGRIERQIQIIERDRSTKHSMTVPIPSEPAIANAPGADQIRLWAEESFRDFGDIRAVIEILEADEHGAYKILRRILSKARVHLATIFQKRSLGDSLGALPPQALQDKFQTLFQCAFPWIRIKEMDDPKNYKLFLGVNNAAEFKRQFGSQIRSAAASTGMPIECEIVEMAEDGKAICYCELSGFPLTKLTYLENWRFSYNKESQGENPIPLHTHRDLVQFKHPLAPSDAELAELKKDFQIFIEGVMTNVVTPRRGIYGFNLGKGNRVDIGPEALIKKEGIYDKYESAIRDQIEEVLDQGGNELPLAMYVLTRYYETFVYPRGSYVDEKQVTIQATSLWTFILHQMRERYEQQVQRIVLDEAWAVLAERRRMERWTNVLPGTEDDIDAGDLSRSGTQEGRDLEYPLYLKRVLTEGWREAVAEMLRGDEPQVPATVTHQGLSTMPPPPAPPGARAISLAISGQVKGPYPEEDVRAQVLSGVVNPRETHAWWPGASGWVLLQDCPDLLGTSMPPPPPPPAG